MANPVTPKDGAAWVTGASSGIGRALSLELARRGWTVAATARSEKPLEELAREAAHLKGRIVALPGDVSDAARMDEIVRTIETELGGLALIVPNAGVYLPVDARSFEADAFEKTLAVNLGGTAKSLEPTIKAMTKRGKGQIAIVASVTGYGGLPTSAAYGASKAALINLAETLRIELDALGVHVQVINPGFVDTPATADNPFPMPALMKVEKAAKRIARGLKRRGFEITFPRRFTYVLKAIGLLPSRWRLALVRRMTGWSDPDRRPDIPS